MGRHAATPAARRSAPLTPQLLIALAVAAVVLVAGGVTWWAMGAASGDCEDPAVVRVAVARLMEGRPEISRVSSSSFSARQPHWTRFAAVGRRFCRSPRRPADSPGG